MLADRHNTWLTSLDSGSAARVVDKMPGNYQFLGLLGAMFPRATYVHCRRDLRNTATSCWMTDFARVRWANDLKHIACAFEQHSRFMDHRRRTLPLPIHTVDYEEAVADLESVGEGYWPLVGSNGTRRAWNSIGPNDRSAQPALCRSASPFIAVRWAVGRITKARWPSCSPGSR